MRVGIIGHEGFIGSAMIRACVRQGLVSIGIDRVSAVTNECDLVIDCNGNSRKYAVNNDPESGYKSIVESVKNRLSQSISSQLYVYISSGEVYGNEQIDSKEINKIEVSKLSNYGALKFEAEQLVQQNRPNHLIIRPSGFVGQGLIKNPIYDLINKKPLFVDPRSRFQFSDVDWFSDIVLKLALKGYLGVYNVSTKETISIQEISEHLDIEFKLVSKDYQIEHHELNTNLLEKIFHVPSTKEVVLNFVQKAI